MLPRGPGPAPPREEAERESFGTTRHGSVGIGLTITFPDPIRLGTLPGGEWATRLALQIDEDSIELDWYRDRDIVVDGETSRSVIVGGDPDTIQTIAERLGVSAPF